jgi:hypothetical protein
VPPESQQDLYEAFAAASPPARVFLHRLTKITLEGFEAVPMVFTRVASDGEVLLAGPGLDQRWLVFEKAFEQTATTLRARHEAIGKRHARVRVATMPDRLFRGLLHATLLTQVSTGLPVHVDASFFPKLDRKGILDVAFEGEWNRAAIACAALVGVQA